MKLSYLYMLVIAATILMLPACNQSQTGGEKVMDNVDDALDRRPGEKILDATEDAGDKIKEIGKDAKENVKDATN